MLLALGHSLTNRQYYSRSARIDMVELIKVIKGNVGRHCCQV